MKKSKVSILMGGLSTEKEISLQTGKQVSKALNQKYDVKEIYVDENLEKLVKNIKDFAPNYVFNALHGKFGEDGQIQSILNYLKIPYSHSGVLCSSLAMNKFFSKLIFEKEGLNCPKGEIIDFKKAKKIRKNFPYIIKPLDGGSSIDIFIINSLKDQKKFFEKFFKSNKVGLVEDFIEGREITIGIFENKVCGITEIVYDKIFYDFDSKYLNIAKHINEPKLPKKIIDSLCKDALKAHTILDCNFISRSDFKYNEKQNKVYLLEINTQPGLTTNSLIPEMLVKKGISFTKMCELILENTRCEHS